jgi:hypothetical protein
MKSTNKVSIKCKKYGRAQNFGRGNVKRRGHLEHLVTDRRIKFNIKIELKDIGATMWIGFICLRISHSGLL